MGTARGKTTANSTPGSFAPGRHDEPEGGLGDDDAPLTHYEITGFVRKEFSPASGITLPGGSCGHCGAALINCVQVRHRVTGETMDVGMDCAERVGLSRSQVKEMMRERFAEERYERWAAQSSARRAELAAAEAAATEQFGEHGTPGRYSDGDCRCGECRGAAPHGTLDRLEAAACFCDTCVEAAVESGRYEVREMTMLVDAGTHQVINEARPVSTRFGLRWAVDSDAGTEWYPFGAKRRSTMLSKGVLEAATDHLVRKGQRGSFFPVAALRRPEADVWGEPLPEPDQPEDWESQ